MQYLLIENKCLEIKDNLSKSSKHLIWGQMALELMHIIAEKSEIWRICLDDLDRHHNPPPTLIGLNYEKFEKQWEMRKN